MMNELGVINRVAMEYSRGESIYEQVLMMVKSMPSRLIVPCAFFEILVGGKSLVLRCPYQLPPAPTRMQIPDLTSFGEV
jgi:hypothetical protein